MSEINKDCVRWTRQKWALVIVFVLMLHILPLLWLSTPVMARTIYPKTPQFSLGEPLSPPAEMKESAYLFAAATKHGFSGEAWLVKPEQPLVAGEILPKPAFISFREARGLTTEPRLELAHLSLPFRAAPGPERVDSSSTPLKSTVEIDGDLAGRGLASPIELPVQYNNDVIGSSVVEVGAMPDGLVISARLISSSRLKKADQDALALARAARFQPLVSGSEQSPENLAWGKLIFRWVALDFSTTNTVVR